MIKDNFGTSDNESKNEPTQIEELQNIKAISVGYSHSLALTKTRRSICMGSRRKRTTWKW
ncbi:MAG: hypothetical protein HFJ24_00100 [Clostridia bacterium]|nr:hypothetical protein [Clostridia bacterium]MCI9274505.1 hypothetical protein [Clostridia bacterium]